MVIPVSRRVHALAGHLELGLTPGARLSITLTASLIRPAYKIFHRTRPSMRLVEKVIWRPGIKGMEVIALWTRPHVYRLL